MSMISGLIDKLRKSEQEWNQSNMFELARMCREAADTIWHLRDDLQRANAENARLRSELESVGTASYLYGRSDLKAENAKLRELVAQRTARRVVTSDEGTDCATGHCECGACGGAVDLFDAYCRHCGARLEDA